MLSEKRYGGGILECWKRPPEATSSVHEAMLSLTEWFVRYIPFSYDFVIDHHAELAARPIDEILSDMSRMRYGCMCGGQSKLMAQVAWREGYGAFELNFGNRHGDESHVVVLVRQPSGDHIIYDPTFGCFSGDTDGNPVTIQTIIRISAARSRLAASMD